MGINWVFHFFLVLLSWLLREGDMLYFALYVVCGITCACSIAVDYFVLTSLGSTARVCIFRGFWTGESCGDQCDSGRG